MLMRVVSRKIFALVFQCLNAKNVITIKKILGNSSLVLV